MLPQHCEQPPAKLRPVNEKKKETISRLALYNFPRALFRQILDTAIFLNLDAVATSGFLCSEKENKAWTKRLTAWTEREKKDGKK